MPTVVSAVVARPNAVEGCILGCINIVVYTCCIPVYSVHTSDRAAFRGIQLYSGLQYTALQRSTVYSGLHSPSAYPTLPSGQPSMGPVPHRRCQSDIARETLALHPRKKVFVLFVLFVTLAKHGAAAPAVCDTSPAVLWREHNNVDYLLHFLTFSAEKM